MSSNNVTEIERKFLLLNDLWRKEVTESYDLKQVYVSHQSDGWLTRLRITNHKEAEITIKGPKDGISGSEYNLPMDINSANDLWNKSTGPRLEKTRHIINNNDGTKWEIDEFKGEGLKDLIFAEIELPNKDFKHISPSWLGLEVSGSKLYNNDFLASSYSNIKDYVPSLSSATMLKDFLNILQIKNLDVNKFERALYENTLKKERCFGSDFNGKILPKNEFIEIFKNKDVDFSHTGMTYRKLRLLEDIIDNDNGLPGIFSKKINDFSNELLKQKKSKNLNF